ncbi:YciI family protein [Ochrobactrum soli]|uniref:YciI family protein n=1 Tax=Ochrobactrum soli TaxID=2448455 RepID=UPI000EF29303|nr:YciI family protein [[Ochrobactrum] soli]RLL64898.1 YciI family protein [[Ochrobactrum] soli]RRD25344.1 YciI family protein [Brucellaceae bacterium VT-16-1752]
MIAFRFAVSDPRRTRARAQLHDAHKKHIADAPFEVLMSGPAFQEGSDATTAALLIANVATLAELDSFNLTDPYVKSGVYIKTWILEWKNSEILRII